MAVACLALTCTLVVRVPPCAAQAGLSPLEALSRAVEAVDNGDYQRAVDLLTPLLAPRLTPRPSAGGTDTSLEAQDIVEAWRTYGLALFFLDHPDRAERAFLEYLKLDVDAGLDPTLVPPEAIVFFEDVRSRHAAELRKYRPKPAAKRYWALNFIPVAGQLQNRHRKKAWLVAGAGVALIATNVSTFAVLSRWCDDRTDVCRSGQDSRSDAARTLRVVNIASAALLTGLAVYAIADGFYHFKLTPRGTDGVQMTFVGRF